MRFDIMTLFTSLVETVLSESIIGRARASGLIEIHTHDIRDFSENKHRRVDDTPYGGGMGMLMSPVPIYNCYRSILESMADKPDCKRRVIYMSPKGSVLTQDKARELLGYDNLVILCGHYEGVDQRIIDEIVDEEISIGDYVLTGGELPACILVDSVSRMIEGVLSDKECYENESIASGLLEYPQYTRPYEFNGRKVPDVLLSGHHENIEKWRKEQALLLTKEKRPDLLSDNRKEQTDLG
ncbi:MAG: tRNA (guanosine(37)-N1)-methyltransferase TrmD [Clostridia bacterium]|nr:tRNA (guanosine(37)-N1)-methyltransferase TrmD [Clostridia bacterium]